MSANLSYLAQRYLCKRAMRLTKKISCYDLNVKSGN